MRMLFIDYRSAFNAIVPSKLVIKLGTEHLPLHLDPGLPDRLAPGGEGRKHHQVADDAMVVGLVTGNDEKAYREEASNLAVWCQINNLSLNVRKTKELIADYRKRGASML